METFKKGEMAWVASSEMDWGNKRHRKYVIYHNGHHYCESEFTPGDLVPWRLARTIPEEEPKPAHYTEETFPKGEVWLRGTYKPWLVLGFVPGCVETKDKTWPYESLHQYKISTDGRRTWRKAVPGSE